ncbi:MAG: TldD/PmbA family protein [Methanosarcinales archaeon]
MLDLAEKALKYANSLSDYAEVRSENFESNKIILKNGNVDLTNFIKSSGLCIRVFKKGSMGLAFISEPDFEKIKKAISSAIKMTKYSRKFIKKPILLSREKTNRKKYQVKEKIKIKNISLEEKVKELLNIEKEVLKTNLNLPVRYFELVDEFREKYFINSEGSKIHSKIPRIYFEYMLTFLSNRSTEQRLFEYGGSGGWELFKKWKLVETLVKEANILSKISKSPKTPKGKFDVILSPELAGIIAHESCGHPYEADRILGREAAQAGESFVKRNMLGYKIGTDVVNLVDNPTIPNSYGFYLYDDEGVEAREKFLIKNGVINTFLHNRETAFEFSTNSNGSARANNWSNEPIVRMSNTYFKPGKFSFDDLIDVRRGIYIKSYMEWNIDDKRLNQRYVGLESYKITSGKIDGLIRRPVLEINTPTLYQAIDAIGKKLEFSTGTCGKGEPMQGVPVWFGGPHIRLRKVII